MAAVHTHTAYGTPLAALAELLRMVSQESCGFYGDQAIYEGEDVDVQDVRGGQRIVISDEAAATVYEGYGHDTTGELVFDYLVKSRLEWESGSVTSRLPFGSGD